MKLIIKGESVLNVPNALSLYRLLMAPVVLYFALSEQETLFAIFICINLVTDMLDGFVARHFNMQTHFGAALDNLADIGTYILAVVGIYVFKWQEIEPYSWALYVFVGVLLLSYAVAFIRFRKIPGLHLYSAVSSGYAQGIFLFVLFAFGFYPGFFIAVILWGAIAYVEKIVVLLYLDDIKIGVRGIYWLLKEQKKNQD